MFVKCAIIVCYYIMFSVKVSICLRFAGVTVPALKQRGDSATMLCDYDMEGSKLYSVKWYRDNEEFYRYMPRLRPPQHSHRLDGVKVDMDKSNARRVHLRDLTLRSRGLYRCEVSEEAPSFHSAQDEAFMEIYYFPRDGPRITGHERVYQIKEPLDVNCSSPKSFPAPEIQWHINGQKVTEESWLNVYGAQKTHQGLLMTTTGLAAPAAAQMKIRCVASIGNHKREKAVIIEVNSASLQHTYRLNYIVVIVKLIINLFCYNNGLSYIL